MTDITLCSTPCNLACARMLVGEPEPWQSVAEFEGGIDCEGFQQMPVGSNPQTEGKDDALPTQ